MNVSAAEASKTILADYSNVEELGPTSWIGHSAQTTASGAFTTSVGQLMSVMIGC